MKTCAVGLVLACVLGLTACGDQEVLHMGLGAEITEIDVENQLLFVKDMEEGGVFGERCALDCGEATVLYCDYATGELKDIGLETLETGDAVIVNIYDADLESAPEDPVKVQQVQLGTQRLN